MNTIIGLDLGTTAVKGVLTDTDGKVLATVTKRYKYYFENGVKYQKPHEYLDFCFDVIKTLADFSDDNNVLAVCSCCASGNLIILDNDDNPLTPIIGWQTAVPQEEIDKFYTEEEKTETYKTVGWQFLENFPMSQLGWIKLNSPDIIDKAKMITMSAEYLNFALTGKWGISQSMGTPFYLLDQEKGIYNQKLLKKLGISEDKLPKIYDKGTVLGDVIPEVAEKLNLRSTTKVVLGSFDHPSAAMGAGVFEVGEMLISCGTSWVEFLPVPSREFAISTGFLVDRFMLSGAPYCIMASVVSISEKIEKLREHYLGKISHKEFDEYVKGSSLGAGGLRFMLTDSDYHLEKDYSKSDIARATIECSAYVLKDNLETLKKSGIDVKKITMVGGISNSSVCVNVISEVLGLPVRVINGESAGAVGSALLAGIGIGIYKNEKFAFETMMKANSI